MAELQWEKIDASIARLNSLLAELTQLVAQRNDIEASSNAGTFRAEAAKFYDILYPAVVERKERDKHTSLLRFVFKKYEKWVNQFPDRNRPGAVDIVKLTQEVGPQEVNGFPWDLLTEAIMKVSDGTLKF